MNVDDHLLAILGVKKISGQDWAAKLLATDLPTELLLQVQHPREDESLI